MLPLLYIVMEQIMCPVKLCYIIQHLGSTVAQWLALSPHSKKARVRILVVPGRSRPFLCGVCMFSPCLCGFTPDTTVSATIIKTCKTTEHSSSVPDQDRRFISPGPRALKKKKAAHCWRVLREGQSGTGEKQSVKFTATSGLRVRVRVFVCVCPVSPP